jgi:hypothetical protein
MFCCQDDSGTRWVLGGRAGPVLARAQHVSQASLKEAGPSVSYPKRSVSYLKRSVSDSGSVRDPIGVLQPSDTYHMREQTWKQSPAKAVSVLVHDKPN